MFNRVLKHFFYYKKKWKFMFLLEKNRRLLTRLNTLTFKRKIIVAGYISLSKIRDNLIIKI